MSKMMINSVRPVVPCAAFVAVTLIAVAEYAKWEQYFRRAAIQK